MAKAIKASSKAVETPVPGTTITKEQINASSWRKFPKVHPLIVKSLLHHNFLQPTEIQSHTLSNYQHYHDFILASMTGSGKTLSFGIPIFSDILYRKLDDIKSGRTTESDKLRALMIAPTRELALQIHKHLTHLITFCKKHIKVGSIVGGMSREKQERVVRSSPNVLIATPGRLWDLIDNGGLEYLKHLHELEYLVIDEADRMIELGHFKEMNEILHKIFHSEREITHDPEILNKFGKQGASTFFLKDKKTGMQKFINGDFFQSLMENEPVEIPAELYRKMFSSSNESLVIDSAQIKPLKKEKGNKKVKNSGAKKGMDPDEIEDVEGGQNDDEQMWGAGVGEGQGGESAEKDDEDDEEEEGDEEGGEEEEEAENDDEEEGEGDDEDEDEDEEGDDGEEQEDEEDEEVEEDEEDHDNDNDNEGHDNNEGMNMEMADETNYHGADDEEKAEGGREHKTFKGLGNQSDIKRKIFLVSATLTQTFDDTRYQGQRRRLSKKTKLKKKLKAAGKEPKKMEGKLDELMESNPKLAGFIKKIKFTGKPKIIDLTQTQLIPAKLHEYKTICPEEDKPLHLYYFLKEREGQSFLIFTNSITYSRKVLSLLQVLKFNAISLHSEMQQRQRLKKLDKFKERKVTILVCTDVAARGLDIPRVENVVHYQIPKNIDTYIHRSGRTARIGQEGTAYSLIGPHDVKNYDYLVKELKREQGIESLEFKIKPDIRRLVESAWNFEAKTHQLNKTKRQREWYEKNAKLCDIDLDDEIEEELREFDESNKQKKVQVLETKDKLKTVVRKNQNQGRLQWKPNSVFLDPNNIKQLSERMHEMKNRSAPNTPQVQQRPNNSGFQKKKNKNWKGRKGRI